jgi:hypothetical protein
MFDLSEGVHGDWLLMHGGMGNEGVPCRVHISRRRGTRKTLSTACDRFCGIPLCSIPSITCVQDVLPGCVDGVDCDFLSPV